MSFDASRMSFDFLVSLIVTVVFDIMFVATFMLACTVHGRQTAFVEETENGATALREMWKWVGMSALLLVPLHVMVWYLRPRDVRKRESYRV